MGSAALIGALLVPAYAQKLGLSSSFGDVTLHNMTPGTAYNIKQLKGHPYSLTNISEVPVELVVDVMPPLQGSVRPLYEEIPDMSWITVEPRQFKLEPGQSASGEVTIKVPAGEQWKDRNFQAALYAHTLQGSFVNVGIYDKLLLSTGKGPDAMKAQGPHLALVPGTVRLGRLKTGKVHEPAKAKLRLRNATEGPVAVTFQAVPFEGKLPQGYAAAPDPAALSFGEPVQAEAGRTVDAPFKVDLKADAAGRKLAFRVKAASTGEAPLTAFGLVLVEGAPLAAPAAPKKAKS